MTDEEFDAALVAAAFAVGAEAGWRDVSTAAAARHAGLELVRARARLPGHLAILKKFGVLADAFALTGALTEGSVKDRLFDILLRRFDFLQLHRPGVLALLRVLPLDAPLAAWLGHETLRSMGWILEGAGVSAAGLTGAVKKRGLAVVWGWGLRSWVNDESEDLSATMAAVDVALLRADQIASAFMRDGFTPEAPPEAEPAGGEPAGGEPADGEPADGEPELPLETPEQPL